jgi:hypothetical protein
MRPAFLMRLIPKRSVIIVVDSVVFAVGPVPVRSSIEFRCSLQLTLSNTDAVATEIGIVFEIGPGHWVVILAHSQKSAKRDDCVGDFAAYFVDHDSLDASDFLVISTINGRPFHLAAADQRSSFTPRISSRDRCCFLLSYLAD